MNDLEDTLGRFGEHLLRARIAPERLAVHFVRWVRHFLSRPQDPREAIAVRVRGYLDELERSGRWTDWQLTQAERAIRVYYVNFLKESDWERQVAVVARDRHGRVDRIQALALMRTRLRVRHYSYRTEGTYLDWTRRFIGYAAAAQKVERPAITAETVKDFLAHLAIQKDVAASTQNQALHSILFLCREVLDLEVEGLAPGVRAKRGARLPVVMTPEETRQLLGQLKGTASLMARVTYGAGLRVSECCRLRVKDVDFDNNLIFVRAGKGDKDRSTLLAASVKEDLRAHLGRVRQTFESDRASGLAPVYMPGALERKYPHAGLEWGWYWVFPSRAVAMDAEAPRDGQHSPECRARRGAGRGAAQARHGAHPAPQLRHAPAAAGGGYPPDPGLPGTHQRGDDDDLHARRAGSALPGGQPAGCDRGAAAGLAGWRGGDNPVTRFKRRGFPHPHRSHPCGP